jgi:anti-sigma-K factor RskA
VSIQDYISSGVLELYVLDDLSDNERKEVETLMDQHPEVKQEIDQIEEALIQFANAHAKDAPSHLQFKIAGKIAFSDRAKPKVTNNTKVIELPRNEAPVVSSGKSNYKWLAAASLALLVGSGITNVWLYERYNTEHNTVLAMREQNSQMAEQTNILKVNFEESSNKLAKLEHPYLRIIPLKGLEKTPECHVTIYWNAKNGETMARANSLPEPPAGKQYQLWAIVDGKPVDMGMFNKGSDKLDLEPMKIMESPQAFSVTLEDEGGVPSPTMETMMVLGNVNV